MSCSWKMLGLQLFPQHVNQPSRHLFRGTHRRLSGPISNVRIYQIKNMLAIFSRANVPPYHWRSRRVLRKFAYVASTFFNAATEASDDVTAESFEAGPAGNANVGPCLVLDIGWAVWCRFSRRPPPPICCPDGSPRGRLHLGWVRGRPPLPGEVGKQRPGPGGDAPGQHRGSASSAGSSLEPRSDRSPSAPIPSRAPSRTRHRARFRFARRHPAKASGLAR
jgi:hypothetical protein